MRRPAPTMPSFRGISDNYCETGFNMAFTRAEPGKTRIGWIGTGVMGRWMCQHLITKGYSATVYNRTKDKAKPLLEAGAAWADTPRAVAE